MEFVFTIFLGGRISVFQVSLPTLGPGAVSLRETVGGAGGGGGGGGGGNPRGGDAPGSAALLGPANDFYKKLALECSGQQVMKTDAWEFDHFAVCNQVLFSRSRLMCSQCRRSSWTWPRWEGPPGSRADKYSIFQVKRHHLTYERANKTN